MQIEFAISKNAFFSKQHNESFKVFIRIVCYFVNNLLFDNFLAEMTLTVLHSTWNPVKKIHR